MGNARAALPCAALALPRAALPCAALALPSRGGAAHGQRKGSATVALPLRCPWPRGPLSLFVVARGRDLSSRLFSSSRCLGSAAPPGSSMRIHQGSTNIYKRPTNIHGEPTNIYRTSNYRKPGGESVGHPPHVHRCPPGIQQHPPRVHKHPPGIHEDTSKIDNLE